MLQLHDFPDPGFFADPEGSGVLDTADFGGRKATATASGIVDGCVYLGSSIQSLLVGYLTSNTAWGWHWWPLVLLPAAFLGGIMAWRIWHELPAATKKYIAENESGPKPAPTSTGG